MDEFATYTPARVRSGLIDRWPPEPSVNVEKHLANALLDWCVRKMRVVHNTGPLRGGLVAALENAPRVGGDGELTQLGRNMCLNLQLPVSNQSDLELLVKEKPDTLIDMVDWLLYDMLGNLPITERLRITVRPLEERTHKFLPGSSELTDVFASGWIDDLKQILGVGGSAWFVDAQRPGLSQRVGEQERDTFVVATLNDDSTSQHLQAGWAAAWGVNPSGDAAYDNAVKALEAEFRSMVTPKTSDSTLSMIAKAISDKPSKWQSRFEGKRSSANEGRPFEAGARLASDIMRTVFQGHHRHGDSDEYVANTVEEGRDAITLAVALVALQRRGFLEIKSP